MVFWNDSRKVDLIFDPRYVVSLSGSYASRTVTLEPYIKDFYYQEPWIAYLEFPVTYYSALQCIHISILIVVDTTSDCARYKSLT